MSPPQLEDYSSPIFDFTNKLDHVGSLYLLHEYYSAAEIYFRKGLDINQYNFGSDSPSVVRSMIYLANLYHSQKNFSQATYFCEQAINGVNKNIPKWQDDYRIKSRKIDNLRSISEILGKLAEVVKKIGLDSTTSRIVDQKIFFIESQIEEEITWEESPSEIMCDEIPKMESRYSIRPNYSIQSSYRKSLESFVPLRRYPYVKFPETLPIGKTAKLTINITVEPSSTSTESLNIIAKLNIFAKKSQHIVPIVVSVIFVGPNNLELIGNDNAVIHVPVQAIDSKPIEFSVRAKKEGYQTIILFSCFII